LREQLGGNHEGHYTYSAVYFHRVVGVGAASAVTLTFEDFAPPGDVVNINPGFPYTEAGFTISVTNDLAAVFDSALGGMPGNPTDFFGFGAWNTASLTFSGGLFDLGSLFIGPLPVGAPISMTITRTLPEEGHSRPLSRIDDGDHGQSQLGGVSKRPFQ
jgi:hypothetical protein